MEASFKTLYRFALLALGSVCGSELNIAVFARIFGRVMPWWQDLRY